MNEDQKQDNIRSLAVSLRLDNPILTSKTSERVARELIESTDGWRPWSEAPKRDAVIVGRDALNFVHNTTHLLGSRDGQWVEMWKQVLV